jgi:hypothetical protein
MVKRFFKICQGIIMKIYLAGCLNIGGFDLNIAYTINKHFKILDSYFYVIKCIEKLENLQGETK